jgi:hypothetical protein
VLGAVQDLGGLAVLDDDAVVHHRDAVGDRPCMPSRFAA